MRTWMIKLLAVPAALAVSAALVLAATSADAATVHRTPAQRTCSAFRAWVHRPTPGRLNAVVRDSLTAPWALELDVIVLLVDVREHDTFDQPSDKAAVADDCRGK